MAAKRAGLMAANSIMVRFFKSHDDILLRRKVRILRGVFLALLFGLACGVGFVAAGGDLEVTHSKSGTRWGSPSVTRQVAWSESPINFAFELVFHFLLGALLLAMLYMVMARLVEHFHAKRPFFRRKYPY